MLRLFEPLPISHSQEVLLVTSAIAVTVTASVVVLGQ
jgi:hypothetical protein